MQPLLNPVQGRRSSGPAGRTRRNLAGDRAQSERTGGPPWRVTHLVSHPIGEQIPLLNKLDGLPWIDLEVIFGSESGDHPDSFLELDLGSNPSDLRPAHRFLSTGARIPRRLRARGGELSALLKRGRTDVLWMHGFSHPLHQLALRLAKQQGIPVLASSDGLPAQESSSGLRAGLQRVARGRLLGRFDGLLIAGSADTRYFTSHGVSSERLHPMPHTIDNRRFHRASRLSRVRRPRLLSELGLESRSPIVACFGPWNENSGVRELLDAHLAGCEHAKDPIRPALVLVGSGPLEGTLRERVRDNPGAAVCLVSPRPQGELPRWFDLADLVVVPSRLQTESFSVSNPMVCGTPVLVPTEFGNADDLIREGRTGFLFDASDSASLARQLNRLIFESGALSRLRSVGKAARKRARDWGHDADANGLFQALESLEQTVEVKP